MLGFVALNGLFPETRGRQSIQRRIYTKISKLSEYSHANQELQHTRPLLPRFLPRLRCRWRHYWSS
jgi:hypothetical protein